MRDGLRQDLTDGAIVFMIRHEREAIAAGISLRCCRLTMCMMLAGTASDGGCCSFLGPGLSDRQPVGDQMVPGRNNHADP